MAVDCDRYCMSPIRSMSGVLGALLYFVYGPFIVISDTSSSKGVTSLALING